MQRSGKLDKQGKSDDVNVYILVLIHVCVAPPMVVGVHGWSMAGALQQLFEYYYYYLLQKLRWVWRRHCFLHYPQTNAHSLQSRAHYQNLSSIDLYVALRIQHLRRTSSGR